MATLGPKYAFRSAVPIVGFTACLGLGGCYDGPSGDGGDTTEGTAGSADGASGTDGEPEPPPENIDLVLAGQSRRMTSA